MQLHGVQFIAAVIAQVDGQVVDERIPQNRHHGQFPGLTEGFQVEAAGALARRFRRCVDLRDHRCRGMGRVPGQQGRDVADQRGHGSDLPFGGERAALPTNAMGLLFFLVERMSRVHTYMRQRRIR